MLVVFCVCIRLAFLPHLFSPLAFEKLKCPVIRGEYCSRNTQFRAHVGDRSPISDRKCINAGTVILDNLTYTTFDGMSPEHFQDYVLARNPGRQFPSQLYAEHLWDLKVKRFTHQGKGNVQPTHPDSDHAQCTTHRGVAVGTQERPAGSTEAFQMHLV